MPAKARGHGTWCRHVPSKEGEGKGLLWVREADKSFVDVF